jgi:putative ABC transport system permease protein
MNGESGLGIRQVDGVNFESYTKATSVRMVEGNSLPDSGDFVIVDIKYAGVHKTKSGDRIKIFDRDFIVAGVYAPETGARMMIPLATMQAELGAGNKCSMFLIKCRNSEEQDEVARNIIERHPEFRVIFTRDLPRLFESGYEGFNIFLNVVTGLAGMISLLVISLTMYTTVAERTRQIGILKSLGASKRFIAAIFIKESLMISAIGVAIGLALSAIFRTLLVKTTGTKLAIEADYVLYAAIGGLASGLLGALYPALRAASQDPVEALSYD